MPEPTFDRAAASESWSSEMVRDWLRKPFKPEQIGKLPATQKRPALDFVGHAAVTDRLNKIAPDWSYTVDTMSELNGKVWIRGTMTIGGVSRPEFGDGDDPKEAIGNFIRRGAMRFGVAIDLWSREELESAPAMEASADAGGRVDQASSASRASSGNEGPFSGGPGTREPVQDPSASSNTKPGVGPPADSRVPDSSSDEGTPGGTQVPRRDGAASRVGKPAPEPPRPSSGSSEGTAESLGEGGSEPSATPAPGGGSSPFSPPPGKGKKYPNAANDGHNHDFTKDGRCRLCGKPATAAQKIAAVEGTTADLGAA
jgi:hypothetical protein